jgi:hypothetical protein
MELERKSEDDHELKEGARLEAWADDEHLDLSEIHCFKAEDATGHFYCTNVAPWHIRMRSSIRRSLAKIL